MIWKNTDSFDTDRKMGNDLEKMGQLIRFVLLCAQKFLDETKKFRVAMLPCYPGFCVSGLVDDGAFKASNPGNDTGAIAGLYDSEQRP